MDRIFKVGKIGTREIRIEEAETPRAAALKAGWDPDECQMIEVTREVRRILASGRIAEDGIFTVESL